MPFRKKVENVREKVQNLGDRFQDRFRAIQQHFRELRERRRRNREARRVTRHQAREDRIRALREEQQALEAREREIQHTAMLAQVQRIDGTEHRIEPSIDVLVAARRSMRCPEDLPVTRDFGVTIAEARAINQRQNAATASPPASQQNSSDDIAVYSDEDSAKEVDQDGAGTGNHHQA
ncbi:hypothetical protein FBEOM_2814 [Fusarium beomiforme]|uniref:Uncharacterized protein n=1 Tax=Fusarium beomiforme TaxID=44412 RepID=A0A9P5AR46_9HYPO|nr:hypothetical protein FBEOM_2814 [Fusarium beomiforme]